jgi:hypothetical protein
MTTSELAELDLLIEKARHHKMTQEEIERQRVNWAINNAPEGMILTTKDLEEISA